MDFFLFTIVDFHIPRPTEGRASQRCTKKPIKSCFYFNLWQFVTQTGSDVVFNLLQCLRLQQSCAQHIPDGKWWPSLHVFKMSPLFRVGRENPQHLKQMTFDFLASLWATGRHARRSISLSKNHTHEQRRHFVLQRQSHCPIKANSDWERSSMPACIDTAKWKLLYLTSRWNWRKMLMKH